MKKIRLLILPLLTMLLSSCGIYIASKITSAVTSTLNDINLYFEKNIEIHGEYGYSFTPNEKNDKYLSILSRAGLYNKENDEIRHVGLVKQNILLYFSINKNDGTIFFIQNNLSSNEIISSKSTFNEIFNEKYEKKENIKYECSMNLSNSENYYCFSISVSNYFKPLKQFVALDSNKLNLIYCGSDDNNTYHNNVITTEDLYCNNNIIIYGTEFNVCEIEYNNFASKDDYEVHSGLLGTIDSMIFQFDGIYIISANRFQTLFYVYKLDVENKTGFQIGYTSTIGKPKSIVYKW